MRFLHIQTILSLALVLTAHAESNVKLDASRVDITLPSYMHAKESRSEKYSAYEKTKCLEVFATSNKRFVGDFCISEDVHFLRDMGVIERNVDVNALPNMNEQRSSLVFASPMSQYEMKPLLENDSRIQASIVDCDIGSGKIYRPTATCHVAVSSISNNRFIYSYFFVKNNLNKKQLVRVSDIKKIWLNLKKQAAEANALNAK
ncbi:hypothetical protein SAMN02745887_03489 [Chitinimonas taiwanensis DSM 18899]|uniref:Uncharacterized protein n=2 Tax=Chitinimonas TaxID=240411 RepID=A0A1K2HRG6_9NEIS|nr:hypothetical protein SAMN02745887_03489 [Chitinimonas taiwanensis DSM 18899]